jgi:hypothetical protein
MALRITPPKDGMEQDVCEMLNNGSIILSAHNPHVNYSVLTSTIWIKRIVAQWDFVSTNYPKFLVSCFNKQQSSFTTTSHRRVMKSTLTGAQRKFDSSYLANQVFEFDINLIIATLHYDISSADGATYERTRLYPLESNASHKYGVTFKPITKVVLACDIFQ